MRYPCLTAFHFSNITVNIDMLFYLWLIFLFLKEFVYLIFLYLFGSFVFMAKYNLVTYLGSLHSREAWWAVWIGSFCRKLMHFGDQNGPDGRPHEYEFWIVSNTKMNITSSQSGKRRWKNGVICLVSMFPSWAMNCKLSKKVHFAQFCAGISKTSKSVKRIRD